MFYKYTALNLSFFLKSWYNEHILLACWPSGYQHRNTVHFKPVTKTMDDHGWLIHCWNRSLVDKRLTGWAMNMYKNVINIRESCTADNRFILTVSISVTLYGWFTPHIWHRLDITSYERWALPVHTWHSCKKHYKYPTPAFICIGKMNIT